jgi:hypothetical protein
VLHAGPHCELLISPKPFYAALTSLMGMRKHGLSYYVTYGCTTNKLETHPYKGAGWLSTNSGPVNVFGLSRNQLKHSSLIALSGSFRIALEPPPSLTGPAAQLLSSIQQIFADIEERTPIEAIDKANARLWPLLTDAAGEHWVALDERFFARLVARHIERDIPILTRIIFSRATRDRVLSTLTSMAGQPGGNMVPLGTDLFWHVRDNRIRSLRVDGDALTEYSGTFSLALTPESILSALSAGVIIPNSFLVYATGMLLPLLRGLGGLFQLAYLPCFTAALLGAFDRTSRDEAMAYDEVLQHDGGGVGMALLQEHPDLLEYIGTVGTRGALNTVIEANRLLTLEHSSEHLRMLRRHKYWDGPMRAALLTVRG